MKFTFEFRLIKFCSRLITMAAIAISAASPSARAASATWNGSSSNDWQTNANWSPGAYPGLNTNVFTSTDVATFGAAGSGTINLGNLINIGSINFGVFNGSAGAFVIGDGNDTLNLTHLGAITMNPGVTNSQQLGVAGTIISVAGSGAAQSYTFSNNSLTSTAKLNIAADVSGNNDATRITTLNINGSNGGTISGVISNGSGGGTVAINKSGSGTWTLTGNNTNTGGTLISGGGVLDIGGSTANGSLGTGTLTVGNSTTYTGGTLNYTRTGGTTQAFGATTIAAGSSVINPAAVGGKITLGAITRQFGGTVNFTSGPGTVTTSQANINGILGGYATFGGSTWAVGNTAANAITGLSSYTLASAGVAPGATANVDVDASNITDWATQSVNTLRFNTGGVSNPTTLAIASGNTLTVSSGGILVTGAVGNNLSTISGGTLTGSAGTGNLIVIQNNTQGGLNIDSVITGTSTTDGVTKSGAGVLTLSGANTYLGRTYVAEGTLRLGSTTALGDSTSIANIGVGAGATLDLNGFTLVTTTARVGSVIMGNITNSSATAATFGFNFTGSGGVTNAYNLINGVGDITFSGQIASGRFVKEGANTLTLSGTANNTGTTLAANDGLTILNGSTTDAMLRGTDVNGYILSINGSGATVRMGANDQILAQASAATGVVGVLNGTFDVNGKTDTINGLQVGATDGTAAGVVSGGGTLTIQGGVSTTAFGANNIVLNNGSVATVLAGTNAVANKNTSATVTLSAKNTYTGATLVNAGTLIVDATGGISASSAITIASGATLQYDGKISTGGAAGGAVTVNGTLAGVGTLGATTVGSTGFIKAGDNGIGILSLGSLNLGTGTIAAQINGLGGSSNAGVTYDMLSVSGPITLGGSIVADGMIDATVGQLYFVLNNTSAGATTGLLNGVAQGGTLTFGGWDFLVSYNGDFATDTFTGAAGGNDVVLQALWAVPEPSTFILSAIGLLGLVAWRLRSRASAIR